MLNSVLIVICYSLLEFDNQLALAFYDLQNFIIPKSNFIPLKQLTINK